MAGAELSYHVRQATIEDIPQMIALDRQCPAAAHWSEVQYRSLFEPTCKRLQKLAFVAQELSTEAGKPVAVWGILGLLVVRSVDSHWEIENIAVSPAYRKKGIGSLFLQSLLPRIADAGGDSVFLEVRESNREARKLYEKHGFRETGRRKSYYHDPCEDAVLYVRQIDPSEFSK